MKRIFVTGRQGKLGSLLIQREGFVAFDGDITDYSSVGKMAKKLMVAPDDLVVNCAGMTSIDECESDEVKAFIVNMGGIENLHKVFGSRVLNISTDQVFSGEWTLSLRKEKSFRSPINAYGASKFGAEAISEINEGKTIRLSRTISIEDTDIAKYIMRLYREEDIEVPDFFFRNYLTRSQAVDGIEYFAKNYDNMPAVVNYGSKENISMDNLMRRIAVEFKLDPDNVISRDYRIEGLIPRPEYGGFNTSLAKRLGFPYYKISDVVKELGRSANV